MPWFLVAALFLGFLGALILLAPKPKTEKQRPQGLDDLRFPRAEEGSPVPLILGTGRMRGPNTIWVGDFKAKAIKKKQKTGLFSSKKVTVGYRYFIGLDLALCLGPCVLKRIWIDKDEVWSGTASVDGTAININKPNLFGGKEKGGGFIGTLRFYTGSQTQMPNAYLESKIDGEVPAYRSTSHIVFEHVEIGESAQLRSMSFEMQRLTNGLGLVGEAAIGSDLNPAEALYQVFTLRRGGLNVSPGFFDLDELRDVAGKLFDESNGISLVVSSPNEGKDIAGEVIRQIDGMMYQDPARNVIVTRLIRNDYDVDDLPIFDESNIASVRDFKTKLWEDTFNQVRVTYTSREKKYENSNAIVQDLANINAQGRLRSTTISYPGITNGELATHVAMRDLAQTSVPLMSVNLETNRDGRKLRPGDPFVWAWGEYGIERAVMRVQQFDIGALNDNRVAIDCVQDEFALNLMVFADPDTSNPGSSIPARDPVPAVAAPTRKVIEAPYFFANAAGMAVPDTMSAIMLAVEAPTDGDDYDAYVSLDAGASYDEVETGKSFTEIGVLQTAITATQDMNDGVIATLSVEVASETEIDEANGAILIGNELFAYASAAVVGTTATITNAKRAALDTIPAAHIIGAAVYFLSGDNILDATYTNTAALRVKVLPNTVNDSLDIATAPYDAITLIKRTSRPLHPVNIKWNGGAAFAPPASVVGPHTVTWANRDRTSLTLRSIVDNTNEFEEGQQTAFRWRKNGGAWVNEVVAPGIASLTFDPATLITDTLEWELWATRDGLDSYSRYTGAVGAAGGVGGGDGGQVGGSTPGAPADANYGFGGLAQIVFPFGKTVGIDPLDIPITDNMTLPKNFGDFAAHIRVNPSGASATFTFKRIRAGVATTVGTLVVTTAGAVTGSTTGSAAIELLIDDILSCEPPAIANPNMSGVSFTLPAVKKAS